MINLKYLLISMQISSKKISTKQEKLIFSRLHFLLAEQKNPNEVSQFLSSFMTETEHLVFAKRLTIAFLLSEGNSYSQIKKELKVSSATISSVADKMEQQSIKAAVKKIKITDQANKWYKKAKKIWS